MVLAPDGTLSIQNKPINQSCSLAIFNLGRKWSNFTVAGDEGVPEGADGEGKQPRVYSPIQQQRRSNLAIKEGGEERPLKEVNPSLEPQTARVVKVNRQKGTEVFW